MKKKIVIGILVILIIGVIVGIFLNRNTKESSDKLDVVTVSEVTRSVFYAPQYIAISEGFFEKYGIKIDLSTGQGADAVMTAVLSNQCDIGFAGPEASIYVYNEGKEDHTEVFAQMTKKDGSFLVSRNKTDEFNWLDLKGKLVIPRKKRRGALHDIRICFKEKWFRPTK